MNIGRKLMMGNDSSMPSSEAPHCHWNTATTTP
jgi:hypothetical protein